MCECHQLKTKCQPVGMRFRRWEVEAHNVRTNISHDGCKGLPHNIMGCCPLPTVSVTKKVNPHEV